MSRAVKNMFFLPGLLIFLACGCSDSKSAPDIRKYITDGSACLSQGGSGGIDCARKNFNLAIKEVPKDCRANWGLILADVEDIALQVSPLLSIVNFCPVAAAPAMKPAALTQDIIDAVIAPVEADLKDIYGRTVTVEAQQGCVFSQETIPIQVCSAVFYAGTDWADAEARALGGMSHLVVGVFNLLLGHNIDLTCIIQNGYSLFSGYMYYYDYSDFFVSFFRKLGGLIPACPNFLEILHPERIDAVPWELAHAMHELEYLPDSLMAEKGNSRAVIHYQDTNGDNTIDGGDTIGIGCTVGTFSNCFTPTVIPSSVSSDAVVIVRTLMDKAKRAWDGMSYQPPLSGITFNLSDVSPLLSAIGMNLSLPNFIAVDAGAFFKGPCNGDVLGNNCTYPVPPSFTPLRRLLPYYTNVGGAYVFPIEAEVIDYRGPLCYISSWNSSITCRDSYHFSNPSIIGSQIFDAGGTPHPASTIALSPDSIPPTNCTSYSCGGSPFFNLGTVSCPYFGTTHIPLLYIPFQDPTLNGSVYVDLSRIPSPYNSGETQGFAPPGNREFNKALAFLTFTAAVAADQSGSSGCTSGCTGCSGGCTLFGPRADGSVAVDFLAFLAPVGVILYLRRKK